MKKINLFFKGIIVGLGKIIPGVSGSVLAITLGIYNNCLDSISNLTKEFKKNISYLTPIGLGILISIIIFSKMVMLLLNNNYSLTMLFFLGLIINSTKEMYIKSKVKINKISNILIIIVIIALTILINKNIKLNNIYIKENFLNNFILGIVEAISMIIPGLSGTALLLILNSYEKVMYYFSQILNFTIINQTIKFFIPFGLGMTICIILLSKILNYLLKKYQEKTKIVILGFVISSIYLMIKNIKITNFEPKNILALIVGIIFSNLINNKIS